MTLPDLSDMVPELICLSVDTLICGILYTAYTYNNSRIDTIKVSDLDSNEKLLFIWLIS